MGKKILLANFMAQIADNIFAGTVSMTVMMSWLGAIAYILQIYFDFSGYSDMAVGLGLMFGFHFEENFNYPYMATSITDFWHRWHISLSRWFRDYVYIPLGGSRVSRSRWLLNMFAVWFLTGIWHGANWTFILWGLIYFVLLVLERDRNIHSRIYTMITVIILWVFFRADSITSGMNYIASMFGLSGHSFYDSGFVEYIKRSWFVLLLAFAGIFPVSGILHRRKWIEALLLYAVFVVSLLEIISASYNPFIYFNF